MAMFEHKVVLNSQKPLPDVDDEFDIMGDIFYVSLARIRFPLLCFFSENSLPDHSVAG
jgi:hypothetical protein